MFTTFGEKNLPPINTKAKPSDILKWKRKPEVATCYKNLFEKMSNNEDSPLTLMRIIQRVFKKGYSEVEMAFVVVVCVSILNPKYGKLKLTTKVMKRKIKYYLVGFTPSLYLKSMISLLILFNFFLRIKLKIKSP